QIFTGGVVNAADYTARLAPGGLISIFGQSLTSNSSVTMNGVTVPVLYSSAGQVNAQVPWEMAGQSSATLVFASPGQSSSMQVALSPVAPAIFTASQDGKGQAATIPFFAVVPGDFVSFYVTGLGAVDPPVATGTKA